MNWDVKSETTTEVAATAVSMAIKKFRQPMVEYLLSGLEDHNKWVRIMAAEMLGTIGDPGTAGYLKPLLAEHDRDTRIVAARSLAMIRSPRAIFPFASADNCGDCMIRLVADEALEKLKAEKGIARHL